VILSDLFGKDVRCRGEHLGKVVDARFVLRGRVEGTLAQAELVGLLVGPRSGLAFLGYERRRMNRPALLKHLLTWRQQGTFLVDWVDVEHIGDHVELNDGYTRWSAVL
jgi:sporulation protein YlmC with PRC-barrel domain